MTVASVVVAHLVLAAVAGSQARRAARAHRVRARLGAREVIGVGTRLRVAVGAWLASRRGVADAGALADAVDAMTAAMAAGVPVVDALEAAARAAPRPLGALDDAVASIRRGMPVVTALDRWAAGTDAPPGATLLAAAFAIAGATGSDPATALAGVGATLRERRAVAREVRALATQARASAAVIALAPVAFSVVTAGLGGASTRFFLGTPVGAACLVVGLALDVAGWRWMRGITESVR